MKGIKWVGILMVLLASLSFLSCSKKSVQKQAADEGRQVQRVQYDKQAAAWKLISRHDDLFDQCASARQKGIWKEREEARAKLFPILYGLRVWYAALSEEDKLAYYNSPTTHEDLYLTLITRSNDGQKLPGFLTLQIYEHISGSCDAAKDKIAAASDDEAAHKIEFRVTSQAMREAFEAWVLDEGYYQSILKKEEFQILDQKTIKQIIDQEWNTLKQNGLVPPDASVPLPLVSVLPQRTAFFIIPNIKKPSADVNGQRKNEIGSSFS